MDNSPSPQSSHHSLLAPLMNYLGELRFSKLFLLMLALFCVDLVVPDLIPFVDELLLGLATLVLGAWRRKKKSAANE